MRKDFSSAIGGANIEFGATAIEDMVFDLGSRASITKVLAGLQCLYHDKVRTDKILRLIEADVNPDGVVSKEHGREGMNYWQIMVLSAARLGANLTFDELQDFSTHHQALRVMLGFNSWEACSPAGFSYRLINDNLNKLNPETIIAIDQIIVELGHELAPEAAETVRGDSFVVGTNIHYPIDRRQLADGIRKLIVIGAKIGEVYHIAGWRKHAQLTKILNRHTKGLSMATRARGEAGKERLEKQHLKYLAFAESIIRRACETMEALEIKLGASAASSAEYSDLIYYLSASEYMRQLTVRRVIDKEIITHHEKLFSIFEPHTELINRGKIPQPIEFGHRVLVIEDAAGFICYHEVMDIGAVDKVVLAQAMETLQQRLNGKIRSASFDCGFHSPQNQTRLAEIVAQPCLPTKGAKQAKAQRAGASIEWKAARDYHAGVESAIHGLQAGNGLDRCRDKTFNGYKRYVSLGILGRNMMTLGRLVLAARDPKAEAAKTLREAPSF